jgi:hypothetical protein
MAPRATNEEYAYFLQNDPRSKQVLDKAGIGANLKALLAGVFSSGDEGAAKSLAANPEIKAAIDAIIEKAAADAASKSSDDDKKAGTFKGPEGFGAVVGVGANPVMEKMTRQNEILEEIKLILQEQSILDRTGVGVPPPFTDRSVPLTAAKEGVA